MVKAVFFDLYETLITEYISNYKPTIEINTSIDIRAFRSEWSIRRPKVDIGYYNNFFEVAREICDVLEQPYDEIFVNKLYQERVNSKKSCFIAIDTEVLECIYRLKEQDVKIGLVSNCSREDVTGWSQCCLSELFDDVVFSYEVGMVKPNPDIYKLACERMGIEPTDAIFVGDGGSDK